MAFNTSSKIGANFNASTTSPTFGLGDVAHGTNDSMFTYVEFSGAVTTGQIVVINTAGTATRCLTSGGQNALNSIVGFPQYAASSGEFGWVAQKGNSLYVSSSGTISPSGVLYVAVTSGLIHTTSASSTLTGVVILAAGSASATANPVLANLTWPRFLTNLG